MAINGGDGSIILTTKVDETGLKKGLGSMKKFGATVGKAFLAIGVAAATATVAITKMAVSAYADYEQLVGGVETLFKDSAGKVLEYANQAFQTAGVSANEYMQQVTSFSASLIKSTAGDTEKAADIANMALIDISDNVNKMGSSMESVTLAYQGFAKQQYMLLDNLKLGYGGTKTEMERLLKDAQALTGVKYDINNLADVYSAIHAIQEQLGITGTTMKEAETTITGSLGMVKASWQNLLTAMAGGGDLDRAINNFVYSLEKFTANIVPVIERTLLGLGQAIQRTLPMLVQTVVSALVQQIPNLVMAVYNMIVGLFKGIVLGIKALFTGGTAKATEVIKGNVGGISTNANTAAENMNDVADATKKAGKEAKKSLAAFDELNILSSGASGGAGAGETPEASMPTISAGSGGGGLLQDMGGTTQTITTELAAIMAVAGGALLAIGLLLLFSGNIIWGISFICAGAVTFGVAMQTLTQQDTTGVISEQLMTILGIAGVALIAIGLILLFSGSFLWGIAFIIAGASALSVAVVALKKGKVTKEAERTLLNIMTIAGAVMLALGVILICFGVVSPLSIGLVVAGAASLAGAIALKPKLVLQNVSDFLKDNAGLIVGISLSLLVLGIILCVCGVVTPLSIGLIVVGATGLVTEIVLNWNHVKDSVSNFLKENSGLIVGISLSLLVLGIILCCVGVVTPLSIGLIVAGAVGLAAEIALNWNFIVDTVSRFLTDNSDLIVGISLSLLVLGIILCCVGVITPLSIGLIVAGAVGLATEIALNWGNVFDSISTFLTDNSELIVGVSIALLILGIILCCVGVITPLSIGLIAAGAVGLATEVALNWNTIKTSVETFLKENQDLIVGISLALLVLGIILCCVGVSLPLGIGLIVVGAAGLASEVALNWDTVKEKVTKAFNNTVDWVKGWGLLVLGIILVISGVGLPLGLALMKKGGANLAEAQDPLWTTIVDKVKEVWKSIKLFWNANIAKYFTAEWWGNLGKKMINGLIRKVIQGLNALIRKLNSFGFNLPDVLGGGRVGFNISTISIPQLAQGTVVPPNRKFLAMLGDNTKEHEIVSPISTMKQAFTEAMIELGGNFGGNSTEVVLEIDGREFGRAVVEQGNRENRRIGTRLVIA